MFSLEIYFVLTLILFIITITFYISKILHLKNRWQNDYINIYYEHKEKFEKKYLNRNKGKLDK